ncbi:MAG: peptidylprolyl isomerase [Fimbriimonadaceae bacterium]
MMRIIVTIALLLTAVAAWCQNYAPKAGETVMKIAVEGRGNVFIRLHTKQAPAITGQIIKLAKQGFYDGQRFHRAVKSPRPYLVQVGDPASKTRLDDQMDGGSGTNVPYEKSGFRNTTGAVGLRMDTTSRTGDSQFYILLADQSILDDKYPVFGQVVEGMDVVKRIERGDRVVSVTILGG